MDKEQIFKWIKNGFDAGAHSSSHKKLTLLSYYEKIEEITKPKEYFYKHFNFKINPNKPEIFPVPSTKI